MSFIHYKETIEENDTVILYISITNMYALQASAQVKSKKGAIVENIFQTTYGALRVGDLIGKPYGSRVQLTKGFGFVLHPTPELWTLTLPHRTQILYSTDISMILMQLDLRPGSVVCEAGTGSGSLSHAIARTVAPTGHLYTFDFHEQRVETVRAEFSHHGLSELVTVQQRDVCQSGFNLEHVADAVFLDLPNPWEVIKHSKLTLKSLGGRLCSFSPCIEQVQRTCEVLREEGFTELRTFECLQREFAVKSVRLQILQDTDEVGDISPEDATRKITTAVPVLNMTGHTGFLTFATLPPQS